MEALENIIAGKPLTSRPNSGNSMAGRVAYDKEVWMEKVFGYIEVSNTTQLCPGGGSEHYWEIKYR